MAKVKRLSDKSTKLSLKAKLLYLFLIPLFISIVIALFNKEFIKFGIEIAAFLIFYLSIKSIDKGLEEEQKYNNAKVIKAPKKYKLYGYIGVAVAIFILEAFVNKSSLIEVIINPIIGFVGLLLYYGKDPFKDKLPELSVINIEKLLNSLNEAEEKIKYIEETKNEISDFELKYAIESATQKAKDIIENIKEDPKDYYSARKFMVVYLDGIKDVITKYKNIDKEILDESYKKRLIELLHQASKRFDEDLQKLKSNEIFDLDVQIDSLKKQLQE